MGNLVLPQVPWDILLAALVAVLGIMFIVFSLGMMLGERRVRGGAVDERRGRGARTRDDAVIDDAVRAIEAAAARAIQDLEARAQVAARLLDEAEGRIAGLREMLEASNPGATAGGGPGSAAGRDTSQPGGAAGAGGARAVGTAEKHALVFRLAGEGLSVPEIARRAGIGRGEAQLILDLRATGGTGAAAQPHAPLRSSAVSAGTTSNRSPTIP